MHDEVNSETASESAAKKAALKHRLRMGAAYTLIGLGFIGLMLPLVPQLPFFLGAAALLGKEHHLVQKTRAWLRRRGIKLGRDHDPQPPADGDTRKSQDGGPQAPMNSLSA